MLIFQIRRSAYLALICSTIGFFNADVSSGQVQFREGILGQAASNYISSIQHEIERLARRELPQIVEADCNAFATYYGSLLYHVYETNLTVNFKDRYLAAIVVELQKLNSNMEHYSPGVFTNLVSLDVSQDRRIDNLRLPLPSLEGQILLVKQINELADYSARTLNQIMSSKQKIVLDVNEEFNALFVIYGKAMEKEYPPMFYHGSTNKFAQKLYDDGLAALKCHLVKYAMDYAAADQKQAWLFCSTNIFYTGVFKPLAQEDFQVLKNEVSARLREVYAGEVFPFSTLGVRKVFSDPIEQLFPKEKRPQIVRPLISPNQANNIVSNIYFLPPK